MLDKRRKQLLLKLKGLVQDKNLLDNFNQYLDLLIEQQHKAMEYSDNMTLMYRSQGSIATLRRLKLLREEVLGVKNEKSNGNV